MKTTFTKKVKEEVRKHIGKNYQCNLSKASRDNSKIKRNLRYKFLNYGMLYDPNKGHRMEFRFKDLKHANVMLTELSFCGIAGKLSINEDKDIARVYVGDAKSVMSIMKILGCTKTLKFYEKTYEYNQKARETNRQVNFEAANIKRSTDAALEQVRVIKKLLRRKNIDTIDPDLRVVIKARMKYKRISMSELAERLDITKSALNHRFIRIKKLLGE